MLDDDPQTTTRVLSVCVHSKRAGLFMKIIFNVVMTPMSWWGMPSVNMFYQMWEHRVFNKMLQWGMCLLTCITKCRSMEEGVQQHVIVGNALCLLTCITKCGSMRHGECSTRLPVMMWCLELLRCWDIRSVGKGRRHWNYFKQMQLDYVAFEPGYL